MRSKPEQWILNKRSEPSSEYVRFELLQEERPVGFGELLEGLSKSAAARTQLLDALAASPFESYRFETPRLRADRLNIPFEFVLCDDPALARPASPDAFKEKLEGERSVACFRNLGKDAWMIVPAPQVGHEAYGHLGAFVREAPRAQQHALFERVGIQLLAVLFDMPEQDVWLSTAGAGVPWLHVRLDSRPKYYRYQPYRA